MTSLKNGLYKSFDLFFQQSPIHSYIRWFEPLVIRALKEYTMSSKVILQQQVLSLLAQLIKLRVNYSLLDADQVRASNKIFYYTRRLKRFL